LTDQDFITTGVGHYSYEPSLPVIEFTFDAGDLKNAPGADLVIFGANSSPGTYTVTTDYDGFSNSAQVSVTSSAEVGSTVYSGWSDQSRANAFGWASNPGPYSSVYDVLAGTLDLTDLGVPQGASVTKVRLQMYSSADLLGVGALHHPKELEIVVQTFIPQQGPNNDNTIWSPFGYFATDPRVGIDTTPGAENNDYRTRLHVTIDAVTGKMTSMNTDAGVTKEFADKAGTVQVGQAEAMEGQDMFHQAGTARRFGSDDITDILLVGSAADPLVTVEHQLPKGAPCSWYFESLGDLAGDLGDTLLAPFAVFVPYIDFSFHMSFDLSEETLKISQGTHDGFPSYEVFARYDGGAWHNVYFWDSKAHGQGAFSLFGKGEFSFFTTITEDLTP
jgi:hypothetical protein